MNRQLATLCFLAAIAIPAVAARRLTVEQVQQILTLSQSMHRTDDVTEQQLSGVKLTARLTGATLQQLVAASPGPKTVQSLYAISDESVLLDPPPDQLSPDPAPDVATQQAIVSRTVGYVLHTLPALPNLTATRITTHFVDTMRGIEDQSSESRGGLFFTGGYRSAMAFRDGHETDDPTLTTAKSQAKDPKQAKQQTGVTGLSSWGEFGPILGVVLVDSAKGKLAWMRWQQQDGKPVAVFQFSVDRSVSHYQLDYCCETSMGTYDPLNSQRKIAILKPGYHGRLEIDPETGTILRILIEADLHTDDSIQRASMMVEYGPVKIGDRLYTCPTRSVAITLSRAEFFSHGTLESVNRMQLNDAQFVDYHRFGSESRLIAEGAPASAETPAQATSAGQEASAQSTTAPSAPASSAPAPVPATSLTANQAAEAAPSVPSAPLPPLASPAKPEPEKEIQLQVADGLPGLDADAAKAPGNAAGNNESGSFTLKVTTRFVDVGLIATDKHGKPITGLKRDEIEIYDNGRQQRLVSFHHLDPGTPVTQQATPSGTFTNASDTPRQGEDVPDLLILLMDESHLPFNDLNLARAQVLAFLKASKPNTRLALYSISEHGFRVIQDVTADRALVEAKLAAWMPSATALSQSAELERRNRQQFDTVHSLSDLNSVNGNFNDVPDSADSIDPELRQMGDSPLRWALNSMLALAHHFAAIPGHKSLAWISGDSVLADWQDKAVGREKEMNQFGAALLHTREALNEAHIALYAVDASSVDTGGISAELKNRNVELNPSVTTNQAVSRDNTPGRVTAQMQQDTRAIQTPLRQLAESTGGRAINKGSDLKAALDGVEQDSAALYEVGFDPDTPADGKFHTLIVKIPSRKEVKLRYRSGYLYNEEATSPKDRLQQAVWNPQDQTGIPLRAEAIAPDDDTGQSTIKLRITLAGLGLEQNGGRWSDNLYIFTAQRNDATQKAQISGDTMRLSLKPDTYETGMPAGIPYRVYLPMKQNSSSVRVIVIDGNSGKTGSITVPASAFKP